MALRDKLNRQQGSDHEAAPLPPSTTPGSRLTLPNVAGGQCSEGLILSPERRAQPFQFVQLRSAPRIASLLYGAMLIGSALAQPAAACVAPGQLSAEQRLATDLFEQRQAWEGSDVVYLGVAVDVSAARALQVVSETGPTVAWPAEQRIEIRMQAERLLKGRLPAAARSHVFSVRVECLPSDLARSRPGDRLVIYTDPSGPNDRSGAILVGRIQDPATLDALGEVVDIVTGDWNQDGSIDAASIRRQAGSSLAGIEIFLREAGELNLVLRVPDYIRAAQEGGSAESGPTLRPLPNGSLSILEQGDGAGLSRFTLERTLGWFDGKAVLQRLERTDWDMISGVTARCFLDLTDGGGTWNGRAIQHLVRSPAVEQTADWSSCETALPELDRGASAIR